MELPIYACFRSSQSPSLLSLSAPTHLTQTSPCQIICPLDVTTLTSSRSQPQYAFISPVIPSSAPPLFLLLCPSLTPIRPHHKRPRPFLSFIFLFSLSLLFSLIPRYHSLLDSHSFDTNLLDKLSSQTYHCLACITIAYWRPPDI